MSTIALANTKGGVGKSTLSTHLAIWLHDQGRDVVLVDADKQRSSSTWITEGDLGVPVYPTDDPDQLIDLVVDLSAKHEFVIVDGPGGNNEVTRTLLCVTDLVVIPCGASFLDVSPLTEFLTLLQSARKMNRGLSPRALFAPNKINVRTNLGRDLLKLSADLDIPTAKTTLRLLTVYADAPGQGTVVTRMGTRAKDAAADIETLMQEIVEHAEHATKATEPEPRKETVNQAVR